MTDEPIKVEATIKGLKRMLEEDQINEGMVITVIAEVPPPPPAGEGPKEATEI